MLGHFGKIASEKRLEVILDDLTPVVVAEQYNFNTERANADSRLGDVFLKESLNATVSKSKKCIACYVTHLTGKHTKPRG